ncbi:hypothetical protein GCM10009678_19360 [Actinomadura kijaniata]|uniref:MFS transporter n=1 Tax=Actinomadura kijaniata TaxID=46161 RepID=UPI002FEAC992
MTGGRVVRQVALAQASLGFTVNSLGACLALLAADLGRPAGELAWLSSSFGAGLLVAGAVGRRLLRMGTQPVLLGSALLAAPGTVLLGTGRGAGAAAVGALLLGLGAAGFVLVTPALLSGPDAAAALARANATASACALLGPPAIGVLAIAGISGRLALLLAVPPLLVLAFDARPRGGAAPAAPADPRPPDGEVARGTAASRRRIAAAWVAIVLAVSIEFCFTIWSTARLQAAGLSVGAAAAAATVFLVGMAVGRAAAARPAARNVPVVRLGCGLAVAGTLGVVLGTHPVPVIAGLALAGLGVAALYPVTLARLVRTPGLLPERSAAYGALASGTAVLGAPAALAAIDTALGLRPAFLLAVLPLAAVLALSTPRPAREAIR